MSWVAALLSCVPILCMGTGCSAAWVRLPNPILTSTVTRNVSSDRDAIGEGGYNLPSGTLTSEASLTRLDEQQVCFRVALRVVLDRPQIVKFSAWRSSLQVDADPMYSDPQITEVPLQVIYLKGEQVSLARYSQLYPGSSFGKTRDEGTIKITDAQLPIATVSGCRCRSSSKPRIR